MPGAREIIPALRARLEEQGCHVFEVSALTGEALDPLVYALWEGLAQLPVPAAEAEEPVIHYRAPREDGWEALPEDDGFRVRGRGVERVVAMTDMNNDAGVHRLQRILEKMGVVKRLRELGAEDGATVKIGDTEFDFVD
jgi:GTP-binding protein